jgi:ligand-binding sensor domain-containing protein
VAGSWTTYTTSDGLGDNNARELLVSSTGTIWVATAGGVSRRGSAELTFSNFNVQNSGLLLNDARDLVEDSQGNVWIATGNGVNRYNPSTMTWTAFQTAEGLVDNDTIAIAVVPRN